MPYFVFGSSFLRLDVTDTILLSQFGDTATGFVPYPTIWLDCSRLSLKHIVTLGQRNLKQWGNIKPQAYTIDSVLQREDHEDRDGAGMT